MHWKIISLLFLSLFIFSFITLGVVYIWLNRPDNEIVKKEFLAENPTFEITSLYVGEGNSDFAEYHINYKKPNDEKIYEYNITYRKCSNSEWKISCKP